MIALLTEGQEAVRVLTELMSFRPEGQGAQESHRQLLIELPEHLPGEEYESLSLLTTWRLVDLIVEHFPEALNLLLVLDSVRLKA